MSQSRQLRYRYTAVVLLMAVTLAVYVQVGRYDFVNLDDGFYVTDNAHVQQGFSWETLRWAFTTDTLANWHPLTVLSHTLDYRLFGLNAGGHHLVNVLFHLLNTLLLLDVLRRMTGAFWPSLWVAALFAVHPLHVESVAWISERKDVLSTFFGLLALRVYHAYAVPNRSSAFPGAVGWYLVVVLMFGCSLMSKAMLVTWPCVMLLLDYWPLKRFERTDGAGRVRVACALVAEKIPLFIMSGAASLVTWILQRHVDSVMPLDIMPLRMRLSNALIAYAVYLEKSVWPAGLAVFYPHPGDAVPLWQSIGALLALVAITALAVLEMRRRPYLIVGWLWYLGTLVPVIGIIQVGAQAMADRYTYVPLIGIFIAVVWGAADVVARGQRPRLLTAGAATAAIAALAITATFQVRHWQNSVTLFDHAIKVTANNSLAHYNLGLALAARDKREEAIKHYREALRICPGYCSVHTDLGIALAKQGRKEEAWTEYQQALACSPPSADVYNNLGLLLMGLERFDPAIAHFSEALRLDPRYVQALNNRGKALAARGDSAAAAADYAAVLAIRPNDAGTLYTLGNLTFGLGKVQEAIALYRKAIGIAPNLSKAHHNLGFALASLGQPDAAIAEYEQAVRLDPAYALAYNNMGNAFLAQDKIAEAAGCYEKALQIDPRYGDAHFNLGNVLADSGRLDEGIQHLKKALELDPNSERIRESLKRLTTQTAPPQK